MSNGLATIQGGPMVLDEPRVKLLSETIANGAPPLEFEMFVGVCNRTGLDPFAKQIYFIQRGGKWSWQTSIDGYRLIADRTGKYAGSDDPEFVGDPDGKHPLTAFVTVYKMLDGQRCPFSATARWSEYYPGDKGGQMWQKMPYLMLGKCAEALALRKAFPAELSGLYTGEEMAQAGNDGGEYIEVVAQPAAAAPEVAPWERVAAEDIPKPHGVDEAYDESMREAPEWTTEISATGSQDELKDIGKQMKAAGIDGKLFPALSRYYVAHLNRLKIAGATKTPAA